MACHSTGGTTSRVAADEVPCRRLCAISSRPWPCIHEKIAWVLRYHLDSKRSRLVAWLVAHGLAKLSWSLWACSPEAHNSLRNHAPELQPIHAHLIPNCIEANDSGFRSQDDQIQARAAPKEFCPALHCEACPGGQESVALLNMHGMCTCWLAAS